MSGAPPTAPDPYAFELGKADLTGDALRGPGQFENPRSQSSERDDGPRCPSLEGKAGIPFPMLFVLGSMPQPLLGLPVQVFLLPQLTCYGLENVPPKIC